MIRTLAILNLLAALVLIPYLAMWLAITIAPDRMGQWISHMAESAPSEELQGGVIGGSDGSTAVFVSSRPSPVGVLLYMVLLSADTIVLWRRRDAQETPGQGATVSS